MNPIDRRLRRMIPCCWRVPYCWNRFRSLSRLDRLSPLQFGLGSCRAFGRILPISPPRLFAVSRLSRIAPSLMMIRYSASSFGWHPITPLPREG